MANIILIAGTYHGGWYWDPIIPALTQAGHRVFAPTLSGLEPERFGTSNVNLSTHIEDVIRVVEANELDDVVLVGWSYGGMVITGAADRIAGRVQKLIYLDAQLPKPGEREWDLIPAHEHETFIDLCADGLNLHPDQGMLSYEPRMQPHPLATKLEPVTYDQVRFAAIDKVFVFAEKWFHDPSVSSPIEASYIRASNDPRWVTHSWPFGHDLVREAGQQVAELIIAECSGPNLS
jgi:pimeloyl-ACP methyl ester carboxylesterase